MRFDSLTLTFISYLTGLANLEFIPEAWTNYIIDYLDIEHIHDATLKLMDIF